MLRCLRPGLVLLLTLVMLAPRAAWAEDKSTARALAQEGREAYDAGDFARAAELLARAEKHFHAPPHLVLEAKARIELKQLVEARELLLAVINEPQTVNETFKAARDEARELVATIDERVAHLAVQVSPTNPEGLELAVDGKVWAADLLDVATPVNPGEHVVVAKAPGYQEATGRITLGEGQKDRLLLELSPGGDAAAAPTQATEEPPPPPAEEKRGPGVASYALWGAGVVGVGVGVTLLLTGADKSNQAGAMLEEDCTPLSGGGYGCSQPTTDAIAALDSDAATQQTIGVIALSVGVAALAGGTVLALVSGPSKETALQTRPVRMLAAPLPGGGFIGLKGAF